MRRIPYSRVPDFTKPLLEVPTGVRSRLRSRLSFLYGESKADEWLPELERIMKVHHAHNPQALIDKEKGYDASERFTERDMVLITYGDGTQEFGVDEDRLIPLEPFKPFKTPQPSLTMTFNKGNNLLLYMAARS